MRTFAFPVDGSKLEAFKAEHGARLVRVLNDVKAAFYNRPRVTHSRKSEQSENRRHPTSTFSVLFPRQEISCSLCEQIHMLKRNYVTLEYFVFN